MSPVPVILTLTEDDPGRFLTPWSRFLQLHVRIEVAGRIDPDPGGRVRAIRMRRPSGRRCQVDAGVAFTPERIRTNIPAHGQRRGRCSTLRRPDRVIRPGTAMIRRRRVIAVRTPW